jgi:hypothetical protein
MLKKVSIVSLVAMALSVGQAYAAVRIDFSGGTGSQVNTPAWRASDVNSPGTFSDNLEVGSAGNDNLGYLRITASTSSVAGLDVLGYIVVIPRMTISNMGGADGVGVDTYDVSFVGGGRIAPGGFRIYNQFDTGLTTPLFISDIVLADHTLTTLGSTGAIESTVGLNLANAFFNPIMGPLPTLQEFAAAVNAGGGDFNASVSSAGNNISMRDLAGLTTTGSASGSVFAVPEPGTFALLVAGAMMAIRARRSKQ